LGGIFLFSVLFGLVFVIGGVSVGAVWLRVFGAICFLVVGFGL
jgi:hypothetical protein